MRLYEKKKTLCVSFSFVKPLRYIYIRPLQTTHTRNYVNSYKFVIFMITFGNGSFPQQFVVACHIIDFFFLMLVLLFIYNSTT